MLIRLNIKLGIDIHIPHQNMVDGLKVKQYKVDGITPIHHR